MQLPVGKSKEVVGHTCSVDKRKEIVGHTFSVGKSKEAVGHTCSVFYLTNTCCRLSPLFCWTSGRSTDWSTLIRSANRQKVVNGVGLNNDWFP